MAEDPLLPPLVSQRAAARARGKSAPAPAKPPKAPPERLGRYFGFGAVVVIAAFALFVWWGRAHPPPTDDYNHFLFVRDQNYWYTEVEVGGRLLTVPFYSHPRDLEDIPVDPSAPGTVLALRDGAGALIIALDPEAGAVPVQAGVQISRLTGSRFQVLNIPTSSALTRPEPNSSIPVATCADANATTAVLHILVSGQTRVRSLGNCVIVEGATPEDTVRAAERFGYALLGIMP